MAKRSIRRKLSLVETTVDYDQKARQDGPVRKTWSAHDLKFVKPKTVAQADMFEHWAQGLNIVAQGSAGSGKTFLAMYLALREMLQQGSEYEKVIIIRSAVQTRDIGHLPGTAEEKLAVFEQPYSAIVDELIHFSNSYKHMKDAGKIEFMSTSFLRGNTFKDCIVIFDEMQSTSFHEISTVITRMGNNSRLILCGDVKQSDLLHSKNDTTGLPQALKVFERMSKYFATVTFTRDDIVRSAMAKQWIIACEDEGM